MSVKGSDVTPLIVEKLDHLCGDENVVRDRERIAAEGFAETAMPGVVVKPGSVEEISDIVLLAAEAGCTILPVGGGTQLRQVLTSHNPPYSGGIGLSLSRLDKVLEFEPDNLSVVAEAGVRVAAVQRLVAEENMQLPVFVDNDLSTIGGQVATNFSSWKRYRYGSMEDYVLGMSFVLPTGKIVKTGGKTVKNVSGYDLTRMIGGSWGTMGILYSVTLKLLPLPEKQLLLVRSFPSLSEALDEGARIIENNNTIAACNLYQLENPMGGNRGGHPGNFELLVCLEGSGEFVESQQQDFSGDSSWKSFEGDAADEVRLRYSGLRKGIKASFFNTVVYGRNAIRHAPEALEFIHHNGLLFDMDIAAGVLEYAAPVPSGQVRDDFWQSWKRICGHYPDHASRFFDPCQGQPLLDRLLPVIDPKQVMFSNNVFVRR